jgi:hypothetical protein
MQPLVQVPAQGEEMAVVVGLGGRGGGIRQIRRGYWWMSSRFLRNSAEVSPEKITASAFSLAI